MSQHGVAELAAERRLRLLRGSGWALPLLLFLGVLAVYAATATRGNVSIDAHAASVEAWKIGSTGSPWLTPYDVKSLPHDEWLSRAPNGHIVAKRMAGPVIAGVPFYSLVDHHADPQQFSLLPAGIASSVLTAGSVTLLFLALRRRLSPRLALTAALTFALATPTWSVSADGLWTHTITQFGIAGAAFAIAERRWWWAGVFLGLGMLGRPHVAVIAAIVGIGLAWSRREGRPIIGLAVPTLAALGVLEVWNRWMFGVWSIGGAYGDSRIDQAASGYGGTGSGQQLLNYLGFFFSADRGFFVWTPLVLLLIVPLVRCWRTVPAWSRWLLLGGLGYTFFQLRLNYFAGGDTFYGYRHGLELLTCAAPALAFAVPWASRRIRLLLPPVIALQVVGIMLGAVSNGFFLTVDKAWVDNSFWLALRTQPAVVGLCLAVALAVGIRVSMLLARGPGVVRAEVRAGDQDAGT